jgi:SAM-dependent methyltransferase
VLGHVTFAVVQVVLPYSTVPPAKKRLAEDVVRSLRHLVPKKTQLRLLEVPGIQRLFDSAAFQRLLGNTEVKEPDRTWTAEYRAQTQTRWRRATPGTGLTWGRELSGEAFVSKVESYASFDEKSTVLEVGPGYGRILRSFLARGIPFKEYYALDISEQNIEYLRKKFPQAAVHFMQANIEDAALPLQFDVGFSSLTFKHLYPSFERGLRNCSQYMSPGGRFIFDLVEGDQAHFVNYGTAYVRRYRREKVLEILAKAGLELVAFDEVVHERYYRRLLVVATKASSGHLDGRGMLLG